MSVPRGDCRRVSARVVWEDSDRPARELWWETTERFAADLDASPDAFLLAALPVALLGGERRIRVEGRVCSNLREGLEVVMATYHAWNVALRPLQIEATGEFVSPPPPVRRRTASFLSGGIDALALLRANRLEHPPGTPERVHDCLLVFGLNSYDFADGVPRTDRLAAFAAHLERMEELAREIEAVAVPLYTNVRTFYPDFVSWAATGMTQGLIAPALGLARRFSDVWLGSDGVQQNRDPAYLHTLLARYFSTSAVQIRLAQSTLTRWEKTRLVADWDAALPYLRTCFYERIPAQGAVNCGSCEKCVRTMLALLAMGKLRQASSYPHDDLTPEALSVLQAKNAGHAAAYSECLEPLRERGRHDLVRPLSAALRRFALREGAMDVRRALRSLRDMPRRSRG